MGESLMEILSIFLDFGNTVFRYREEDVLRQLSLLCGKSTADVQSLVGLSTRCPDLHSVMYRAGAGDIGTKKQIKLIRKRLNIASGVSNQRIRDALLTNSVELYEDTIWLLVHLSDKFVLGVISNVDSLYWENTRTMFPALSETAGIFSFHTLSYREKLMKPHRQFFETALQRAYRAYHMRTGRTLTPEECLVLDDHEECVATARALGIRAERVHVPGRKGIADALVRAGISLPPVFSE
jgi:FMN phosphatase YigB (HAD superfamily)